MRKLKRVVIKEEMVALTGHFVRSLILNQFIYWSERKKDFDQFINEERQRNNSIQIDLTHGWIYKTAQDLIDELMVNFSEVTMRRHLKALIEQGYLHERNNPHYGWDQTKQYRPDMITIQKDLSALGYNLDGYPVVTTNLQNEDCNLQNEDSIIQNEDCNLQNEGAIPETTTEITAKTTTYTDRQTGKNTKQCYNINIDDNGDEIPQMDYLNDELLRICFESVNPKRKKLVNSRERQRWQIIHKQAEDDHTFYQWIINRAERAKDKGWKFPGLLNAIDNHDAFKAGDWDNGVEESPNGKLDSLKQKYGPNFNPGPTLLAMMNEEAGDGFEFIP